MSVLDADLSSWYRCQRQGYHEWRAVSRSQSSDDEARSSLLNRVLEETEGLMSEIRNKESFLGIGDKNADGSPVKEVVEDGKVIAEISNKESLFGIGDKNEDGSPVQEVREKE